MSKAPGNSVEKKPSAPSTQATQGAHAEGGGAAHSSEQGHSGAKRETGAKGKAHAPIAGACFCVGCKAPSTRFNFCTEHYDHFKFGLIKKSGEFVPDYEKKIEHYMAYQAKGKPKHAA